MYVVCLTNLVVHSTAVPSLLISVDRSNMAGSEAWPTIPTGNKDHGEAAVVIIGGGISGICTAIDLIQRNNCRNFIILEKSGGVGGTWRDNKYPGCCCDGKTVNLG